MRRSQSIGSMSGKSVRKLSSPSCASLEKYDFYEMNATVKTEPNENSLPEVSETSCLENEIKLSTINKQLNNPDNQIENLNISRELNNKVTYDTNVILRRKSVRGLLIDNDKETNTQSQINSNPVLNNLVENKARKLAVKKNQIGERNITLSKNTESDIGSRLSNENLRNLEVINQSNRSKSIETANMLKTSKDHNIAAKNRLYSTNSFSIDFNERNLIDKYPMVNIPGSSCSSMNINLMESSLTENSDVLKSRCSKTQKKLVNNVSNQASNFNKTLDLQTTDDINNKKSKNYNDNIVTVFNTNNISIEETIADIKSEENSMEETIFTERNSVRNSETSPTRTSTFIKTSLINPNETTIKKNRLNEVHKGHKLLYDLDLNVNNCNLSPIYNNEENGISRRLRRTTISIERSVFSNNTLTPSKKIDTSLTKRSSNLKKKILKVRLNRSTVKKYFEKLQLGLLSSSHPVGINDLLLTPINKPSNKNKSNSNRNVKKKNICKKVPKKNAFVIKFGKNFNCSYLKMKKSKTNISNDDVCSNVEKNIEVKMEDKTDKEPNTEENLSGPTTSANAARTTKSVPTQVNSGGEESGNLVGDPKVLISKIPLTNLIGVKSGSNVNKKTSTALTTQKDAAENTTEQTIDKTNNLEAITTTMQSTTNSDVATSTNTVQSRKRAASNDNSSTTTRKRAPRKPRTVKKFVDADTQTTNVPELTSIINTNSLDRTNSFTPEFRECEDLLNEEINYLDELLITSLENGKKINPNIRKKIIKEVGKTQNINNDDIRKFEEFLRIYARKARTFLSQNESANTTNITCTHLPRESIAINNRLLSTIVTTSDNDETNVSNLITTVARNNTSPLDSIKFLPIINNENQVVEYRPIHVRNHPLINMSRFRNILPKPITTVTTSTSRTSEGGAIHTTTTASSSSCNTLFNGLMNLNRLHGAQNILPPGNERFGSNLAYINHPIHQGISHPVGLHHTPSQQQRRQQQQQQSSPQPQQQQSQPSQQQQQRQRQHQSQHFTGFKYGSSKTTTSSENSTTFTCNSPACNAQTEHYYNFVNKVNPTSANNTSAQTTNPLSSTMRCQVGKIRVIPEIGGINKSQFERIATSSQVNGNSANTLIGGNSANTMREYNSASTLLGGNSASTLLGGNSASTLLGGNSASTLLGGNSASTLLGGNSARTFMEYNHQTNSLVDVNLARTLLRANSAHTNSAAHPLLDGNSSHNLTDSNSRHSLLDDLARTHLPATDLANNYYMESSASTLLGGNSASIPRVGGSATSAIENPTVSTSISGKLASSTGSNCLSHVVMTRIMPKKTQNSQGLRNSIDEDITTLLNRGGGNNVLNNLYNDNSASTLLGGNSATTGRNKVIPVTKNLPNVLYSYSSITLPGGSASTLLGGNSARIPADSLNINRDRNGYILNLRNSSAKDATTVPYPTVSLANVYLNTKANHASRLGGGPYFALIPKSSVLAGTSNSASISAPAARNSDLSSRIATTNANRPVGLDSNGNNALQNIRNNSSQHNQQSTLSTNSNSNLSRVTLLSQNIPPSLQIRLLERRANARSITNSSLTTSAALANMLRKASNERQNNKTDN